MSYVNGMMPGPDLGSKPSGNSNSLVPEIANRGVVGQPIKPCKHGQPANITMSTNIRNNSFSDLKGTGKS